MKITGTVSETPKGFYKIDLDVDLDLEAIFAALERIVEPKAPPKRRTAAKGEPPPEPDVKIDPAVAAQDAADEAAEAARSARDKLTIDDVRIAVEHYADRFGMGRALLDINEILGCSISDLKQPQYAHAIAAIEAKVEEGDAGSTEDDVMDALREYAAAYDGQVPLQEAVHTLEDAPKILSELFGGNGSIKSIPKTPDGYGRATQAIRAALKQNRFKRSLGRNAR